MRILILIILLVFISFDLSGQTFSIHGKIIDEKGNALLYATVSLLSPADSTLSFYGVTNQTGDFNIKNIASGNYVLQAAFIGYKTYYKNFTIPFDKIEEPINIMLTPKPLNLPAAEVNGERIPILFRGDTIEYNAISYKTQPDAVVEDLLKKLPGISIDRNGKIKAQGEEVQKVTVDGKEFFGNDPKIATRNLPADAINKVRVFDTKSDQAQLTGIDDGKRDKTIDLSLKDDHKNSWLGDLQAGAGTDKHYQSSAKIYRFTPEQQIAGLGMLNNINKFGFSFNDYLNFNGGLGGSGESFKINTGENDFPIDFGEPENGLITSGAAGLNYSYEAIKDKRFHASYLANGINKELSQDNKTENFTSEEHFHTVDTRSTEEKNRAHRIDLGWKNRIDSLHTLNINANGSLNNRDENYWSGLINSNESFLLSSQENNNLSDGRSVTADFSAGYYSKLKSKWKLFSFTLEGSWKQNNSDLSFNTHTIIPSTIGDSLLDQSANNKTNELTFSAEGGLTRKTGKYGFLEFACKAGREDEKFSNTLELHPEIEEFNDSLSEELTKLDQYLEPAVKFKKIKNKVRTEISLAANFNSLNTSVGDDQQYELNEIYFLPSVSWEKEYRTSHRVMINYFSTVEIPKAWQLYPMVIYLDPLEEKTGNNKLHSEIHHNLNLHWSIFDQFSFRSLFAGLRFNYVHDKISWSKQIDDNYIQKTTLINVPDDYTCGMGAEFTSPLRKLGMSINFSIDEKWNQTITYINNKKNSNSSLTHKFEASIENRKKKKWDLLIGAGYINTSTVFSLPDVPNQQFSELHVFADLNFNPNDRWHISLKADLTHYFENNFSNKANIPLLRSEISYSFLKNKRGTLMIDGFDLLNRNTGIERKSEYNYIMESHSDIIKRYLMISFKYRLSKYKSEDRVDVKMK